MEDDKIGLFIHEELNRDLPWKKEKLPRLEQQFIILKQNFYLHFFSSISESIISVNITLDFQRRKVWMDSDDVSSWMCK